ncbi:MAG: hypothetical protein ACRCTJ_04840, partial [Brevinema sp.]
MKLLILLLLISSNGFAQYKKVKEINGLKIPKGIVAKYDNLANQYCINTTTPWESQPLRIRIKNTGKGFYPVIDTYYITSDWIWIENIII